MNRSLDGMNGTKSFLLYIDTQKPPGSFSAAGGFFYGGWSDGVMEELVSVE